MNRAQFTVDGQAILREAIKAGINTDGSPIAGLVYGLAHIGSYLSRIAKLALGLENEELISLLEGVGYIETREVG